MGPLIGILVPLTPFLFEGTVFTMDQAAFVGVGLALCVLGTFGAYMGSISDQRWCVAAIRIALAGLVVAAINLLLPT